MARADLDEGRRHLGLTTDERQELIRPQRENRVLREGREILSKAAAWFARAPARCRHGVPIRERESGKVRIATMCRGLEVFTSGFYAWCQRLPSARAQADAGLSSRVRAFHEHSL